MGGGIIDFLNILNILVILQAAWVLASLR